MKLLLLAGLGSTASAAAYTREQAIDGLRSHVWKATDQVYSWIKANYNGEYQNGLEQVNDDFVKVAFKFCDVNGDGHVTKEELMNAIKKTESDKRFITSTDFMVKYEEKYWDFVDHDNDGSLDYTEFKATWSDFAAIQARMNLNLYDKNHNYLLDSDEIVKMMSDGEFSHISTVKSLNILAEGFYKLMGIHFTSKERSDLGKIHSDTETDGKPESRSWMEQINFILGHYSYLIQKL